MPEGDAVLRTARRLDRALTGLVLIRSDLRVPEHATADLAGGRVLGTVARGKHLLTRITDPAGAGPYTLHTHLRMEGRWDVYVDGARWRRPAHQARVVLEAPGRQAVGFSLGVVDLLRTADEGDVVGHLGPDLLGPDWDLERAVDRLRVAPELPLGQALLDQRNLAGLGTIYTSEACFVAGVAPLTPVGHVPDLPRLLRRAQQMLAVNAERHGSVTTGDRREPHWVYGRSGRPCRRCGTTVREVIVGPAGRERTLACCPSCQPVAG